MYNLNPTQSKKLEDILINLSKGDNIIHFNWNVKGEISKVKGMILKVDLTNFHHSTFYVEVLTEGLEVEEIYYTTTPITGAQVKNVRMVPFKNVWISLI